MKLDSYLIKSQKLTKNGSNLNMKAKTINLSQKNFGVNLHDLGLVGNRSLGMMPKEHVTK